MTPRRQPGWRGRLDRYVDAVRAAPFDWRANRCDHFAAGAVAAITGADPTPAWAARIASRRGALAALARRGHASVSDAAAELFYEIAPAMARIGDLAAIPSGDAFGDALGVVIGERVLILTAAGVDSRDRAEARRAFAVG